MSGETTTTAGVSTTATSAAVLPATGGIRPLFFVAAVMLALGVIILAASGVQALKNRKSNA